MIFKLKFPEAEKYPALVTAVQKAVPNFRQRKRGGGKPFTEAEITTLHAIVQEHFKKDVLTKPQLNNELRFIALGLQIKHETKERKKPLRNIILG